MNGSNDDPLEQITSAIRKLEIGLGDGESTMQHFTKPVWSPADQQQLPSSRVRYQPFTRVQQLSPPAPAYFEGQPKPLRPFELPANSQNRITQQIESPQPYSSQYRTYLRQPSGDQIFGVVSGRSSTAGIQNTTAYRSTVTDTSNTSFSIVGDRPSSTSRILIKPPQRSIEMELNEKVNQLELRVSYLEQQQDQPAQLRPEDLEKLAVVSSQLTSQQAIINELQEQNRELSGQLQVVTEMQKLHEEELKAHKIKILTLEKALKYAKGVSESDKSCVNTFERKRLELLYSIGNAHPTKQSEAAAIVSTSKRSFNLLSKR